MALPRVTQLNIVHGSPQEEGPYTFVEALGQEGASAYLFLLFEADGPNPQEACKRAIELYLETFEGSKLSLTGRMIEGLRTIHEAVLWENRHSLPEHQITIAGLAAYLRGDDLYLAHAGPSLAYIISPTNARHLAPAPGSPSPRLGAVSDPPVWVRRHSLVTDEVVLLAGSCLAVNGERAWLDSFRKGVEEGMVGVYRAARRNPEFAAMIIDPGAGLEIYASNPPGPAAAGTASAPAASSLPAPPYSYQYRPGDDQWARPGRSHAPLARPNLSVHVPHLDDLPRLRIELKEPKRWVRNYTDLVPPRVMFAILIAFILGGLALGARAVAQQLEEGTRAEAVRLMDNARDLEARAQGAETGNERRSLMNQALQQLALAQKYDPNNELLANVENRIKDSLTELDAVVQLDGLAPVLELSGSGSSQSLLRDMVSYGGGLYLLDKSNDSILQAPFAQLERAPGQFTPAALGQANGSTRRNLVTLVWLARGGTWQRDSLLALDQHRSILEFSGNAAPAALPIRGAQEWASFQTAVGFGGNLYVLDPRGSQVWRYTPNDRGFDTERRAALPSVDVRDAVDIAVDGDIYVLLRTGQVLKFSNGRPLPFTQDGLDKPMLNPVGIFAGEKDAEVYVVDAGNNRVAVFGKEDGRFLRQFPLPANAGVHEAWVDGEAKTIYLVSDNRLYRAKLPG